ncbi:hypothetical protein ACOSQ3_014016 [Xanthoceras sorbifolium]
MSSTKSTSKKTKRKRINIYKKGEMAKTYTVAALVATVALCLAAIVGVAHAEEKNDSLIVEGKIYCDTCRVQFKTSLSESIEGAKVKLVCRDRESEETKLELEGVTDKSGGYSLKVEGDHAEEICEVHLISSPKEYCKEITTDLNSARILLSTNDGVVEPIRRANALGFMKKEALDNCGDVLKDLGFLPVN